MAPHETSDLLSVKLLVNGKVSNALIKKIEVNKSINKISKSRIVLQDGSKAKEDFKLSDSSDFVPGNSLEIMAGYHSKEKTIFKGIIISQHISIDAHEGPSLLVESKDEAITTSIVRKNAYFLNSTDSTIINKILENYAFSKSVSNTTIKYEKIIQYGATDWDFIISRAEINGLVIITDDGKLSVERPVVSDSPVATLNYGDNIIEMNLALGSDEQLMDVEAIAWDAANQTIIKGKSKEPSVNKEGSLTGIKLASVLNANYLLQSPIALEKDALDAWANAQLLKSRLSCFQGTILCAGNPDIKPNTLVKIQGVGEKVNGNCFVSSITHNLEEGQWLTEIRVGLQKKWFVEETQVSGLKAAGRIPALSGLHIGKVKKIDNDPAGEFRVHVTLPLIQSSNEGIWARLSSLYASKGFGGFFYPEIGDEVILGFLDDNPSAPIILGSVYSKANNPKLTPDEKNTHKAIITRTLMSIDFNEESKTIKIETPGKNIITISDKDMGITLTDQNNNVVQLSEAGILIDSKKDIVIKAANNISVSAVNIDVKASNDINMSSLNTSSKASIAFTAQGGASAELKSSGNVTVKGAMVAIN